MASFLENIFSIKNEYNYKVIRFCFLKLKIFNSKRAHLNLLETRTDFYKEFDLVLHSYFFCTTNKDAIVEIGRFCNQSLRMWRRLPATSWLIFISVFLEKGYKEEAERMLKKFVGFYHNNHYDGMIGRFLPVAALAKSLGYKSERIEKSAYCWEQFQKPDKLEKFKKYLEGKTVALVGGSGCELGKGKGKEIDSHDVVLRFNNYPEDKDYEVDYGKKTNIWVRQNANDVINKQDLSKYDYVIWADDMSTIEVRNPEHLETMYNYLKNYEGKLIDIDSEYYKKFRTESNVLRPTSGAMVLFFLKELLGSLDKVDAYGFAFINGNENDDSHYFDNLCKISEIHDFFMETPFLNEFYHSNK